MNAVNPSENIFYEDKAPAGVYKLKVNYYSNKSFDGK